MIQTRVLKNVKKFQKCGSLMHKVLSSLHRRQFLATKIIEKCSNIIGWKKMLFIENMMQ
jgi:hypothetical protein